MSGKQSFSRAIFLALALLALCCNVLAGGGGSNPCEPEELHWTPKAWRKYMQKGQQVVHDAYAKAADIENQRREAMQRQISLIGPQKNQYGDPMYAAYGPRAYVGTPQYVGPRYASSFEWRIPAYSFQSSPQVGDPSVYVPSAPARSDVVLKPSAARPY
jgi:hypothetical protein